MKSPDNAQNSKYSKYTEYTLAHTHVDKEIRREMRQREPETTSRGLVKLGFFDCMWRGMFSVEKQTF